MGQFGSEEESALGGQLLFEDGTRMACVSEESKATPPGLRGEGDVRSRALSGRGRPRGAYLVEQLAMGPWPSLGC